MSTERDAALEAALADPAKVSVDGVTVEQHSLPDQIAADQHLARKAASRRRGAGLRLVKLRPPAM